MNIAEKTRMTSAESLSHLVKVLLGNSPLPTFFVETQNMFWQPAIMILLLIVIAMNLFVLMLGGVEVICIQ